MPRTRAIALTLLLACGGRDPAPPEDEVERVTHPPMQPQEPALETEVVPPERPPEQTAEAEAPARCEVPAIPIPRPRECRRGRSYPECKWQMPHATLSDGRYRRWRNTIMEHWWGRPSLVTAILGTAHRFHESYPEQVLAIGDLDAPGPRHRTHDNGVDVDLYLLGAMMVENAGGGRYPSNHEGKSDEEIEALRERVLELAKSFAVCTGGKLRIYYNDEPVVERFLAWYELQGYDPAPFETPMRTHNALHEFHFHVTIAEDLAPLPVPELPEGTEHPIARIEEPPPPGSAPHLSSMNREPGMWARVPRE